MSDEKKAKPPGPGFYPVVYPKEDGVFMTLGPGGGGGLGTTDDERDSLIRRLLVENERMREALKEAKSHVFRQQAGSDDEEDRAEAAEWLYKWRDLYRD